MKVLVTDGNNRAALAITRALGKEGFEVVVGAESLSSLAGASKYCAEKITYPSPLCLSDEFVGSVLNAVKKHAVDILFPVSDITTMLVTAHIDEFKSVCAVPFPDHDTVLKAADKVCMLDTAKRLGISVPKSVVLYSLDNFNANAFPAEGIDFPVVVKPHQSKVFANGCWQSTGVQYASDKKDLTGILEKIPPVHYPVLLQERIIGPGVGLFLCLHQGDVVACFRHKRLREKPPSGGVSVLRQSVPPVPFLVEQSGNLLREIGWQGVAMVEFKHDIKNDRFKLMEVNGRFWGSLQLAIDAGVNFPLILAAIAAKEPIKPVLSYKTGVKTRWLLGDLDSLFALILGRSFTSRPLSAREKFTALREFFRFREKGSHLEILNSDDIKPWFFELSHWLKGGK